MGSLTDFRDLHGKRVYLDANVFIYGIDDLPPWNKAAGALLLSVDRGDFEALTSELTLAECLVKPFQTRSQSSVDAYLASIQQRAHLAVLPVSREILVAAAERRSTREIKLPDAIHFASYHLASDEVFVTNDIRVKRLPEINCLLLSELAVE